MKVFTVINFLAVSNTSVCSRADYVCFLIQLTQLENLPFIKCKIVFCAQIRVAIRDFFVHSENLEIRIWRKNCVNYDIIEFTARLRKSHI